jgi:hypothetical protein
MYSFISGTAVPVPDARHFEVFHTTIVDHLERRCAAAVKSERASWVIELRGVKNLHCMLHAASAATDSRCRAAALAVANFRHHRPSGTDDIDIATRAMLPP